MTTIRLRLDGKTLHWSSDGASWGIVGRNSPLTGMDPDREIEWLADRRTIKKLEIEPDCDDPDCVILEPKDIEENGTAWPMAKIPADNRRRIQKYTIRVTSRRGDEVMEFDPEIQVPQT